MNKSVKIAMITVAVIFDLIEILFTIYGLGFLLNRILTIIEYTIFGIWYYFEDIVILKNTKKIGAVGGTFVTEMIPFLGSLPGLTIGVILVLKAHEEELRTKKASQAEAADENIIRPKRSPNQRITR